MPSLQGQGQSDVTGDKQRGLGAAFSVNLKIFQAKFARTRYAYWHFDLHAGSGYNDEAQCAGSPVSFLRAAAHHQVDRLFAGFCEVRRDAVDELLKQPELQDMRAFVFHGDNRELIGAIPEVIRQRGEKPQHAVGSVLADPNGSDIPVRELAQLGRECPKLDVFVNWSATANKRHRGRFGCDSCPSLSDAIDAIGKRHWLIREPLGAWQWTLLIGRNVAVGDHKALGFYDLASPKGQEILEVCNYTSTELRARRAVEQERLF